MMSRCRRTLVRVAYHPPSLHSTIYKAGKCKELRLCSFKKKTQLAPLTTVDQPLEVVTSHEVLGHNIQNDLKWNEHIASVVDEESKRLHILRVLRRGSVPAADLVSIYMPLIRSILE